MMFSLFQETTIHGVALYVFRTKISELVRDKRTSINRFGHPR